MKYTKPREVTLDRLSYIIANLNLRVCPEISLKPIYPDGDFRDSVSVCVEIGTSIYVVNEKFGTVRDAVEQNWPK